MCNETQTRKIKVAVLFGGNSTEHEVSLSSSTFVINSLDSSKYEIIPIYISKSGEWFLYQGTIADIKNGYHENTNNVKKAILSPDTKTHGIIVLDSDKPESIYIDVIFPVLHGKNGEDGTVQGLAALANIPIVGCGVLSSAACMDKVVTKIILDAVGIKNAPYCVMRTHQISKIEQKADEIEAKLGYPCFVKPANAGSSMGVSKAKNRDSLITAINEAFKHDSKVLIEKAIIGKEVECAVFGKDEPFASVAGEIEPAAEFYDYNAKYHDDHSKLYIPARIPADVMEKLRNIAKKAFLSLDCAGLTRIDFFVTADNDIILNELNTLPGFTPISMYPKLMNECGYPANELVDQLIKLAMGCE